MLEHVARNPRRFGAVIAFAGGLIGPPGTPRTYAGRLDGTPIFLGCSDVDPHIPLARVQESTAVLRGMGGVVTERIYPGFGHGVNDDEIAHARRLLQAM
jgi:predicted esterase